MFEHIRNLLGTRKKYKFDKRDQQILMLSNAINSMQQQIAHIQGRSQKYQELIGDLRERERNLTLELQEAKRLLDDGKKKDNSSLSVDTDLIIDVQNELKTTKNQIILLKGLLNKYERETHELRAQYNSKSLKLQHSEKRRAHLQIACARAEINAVQRRIQACRSRRLSSNGQDSVSVL